MDITDHTELGKLNSKTYGTTSALPSLRLPNEAKSSVKAMMEVLDDKHLRADITKLSSFWNRSYRSGWGLLSSNWIHDQAETVRQFAIIFFVWSSIYTAQILETVDKNQFITSVTKFPHKFPQNSIIARIETNDSDIEDKDIIVISAHQVSTLNMSSLKLD